MRKGTFLTFTLTCVITMLLLGIGLSVVVFQSQNQYRVMRAASAQYTAEVVRVPCGAAPHELVQKVSANNGQLDAMHQWEGSWLTGWVLAGDWRTIALVPMPCTINDAIVP